MNAEAVAVTELKDRKTGLVVFGILQIVLAALCVLAVLGMLLGAMISALSGRDPGQAAAGLNLRTLIPGAMFYVGLAVWFVTMGIGSIRARRWARALVLVAAWVWLIAGVVGLIFLAALLPHMTNLMTANGQVPPAMAEHLATVMKIAMVAFTAVFYVMIPGALVLFYGRADVKATCERRDPQARWTDRCPLPVLALSLASGVGAVCMPLMGFYGWALPFFGVLLSGAVGAAFALAAMALLACIAWGSYRLDIRAWWCAVAGTVLWGISTVVTFSRVDLMELYERMNIPGQQLDAMRQVMPAMERWFVPMIALWAIILLGYLFWVRKYFVAAPGTRA